jgi:transcriptional regulator with XRE-family HTH domain
MSDPIKIHAGKTPPRVHYIAEWAEHRNVTQADIVRAIGADKSVVHRWFVEGNIPSAKYLEALAAFLEAESVSSLFRDPSDDWIARLFKDRSEAEKAKAIQMLELLLTGTDNR